MMVGEPSVSYAVAPGERGIKKKQEEWAETTKMTQANIAASTSIAMKLEKDNGERSNGR